MTTITDLNLWTSANDWTGTTGRDWGQIINDNFDNLNNDKAEKTNVLELDNTTAFTPTSDYEPATKKYVDDNAWGGGSWDMLKTIYDPQVIEADAFDRTNHTGKQTMSTISDAWALAVLDTVWTTQIDNDAVTLDKIQNIATNRVLARSTAWVWSVEELTLPNFRTLINVEDWATADQTASEIKTAYESNADTNAFTDANQTKLAWIEAGAEVNTIDSDPTGITGADQVTNIVSLTQAEYNAIGTPSADTQYLITDA